MKKKFILLVLMLCIPMLFAACKKTEFEISAVANNASYGVVTGSGVYKKNEHVTITATANDGYYFESWNDGDENATREIVVTEDKKYTAIFKANEQTTQFRLKSLSFYLSFEK